MPTQPNDFIKRLMALKEEAFPKARWALNQGRLDFKLFASGDLENDCGTTGCLAGWMATCPAFKADGWRINLCGQLKPPSTSRMEPTFGHLSNYFDIKWDLARRLFSGDDPDGSLEDELAEREALLDQLIEEARKNQHDQ